MEGFWISGRAFLKIVAQHAGPLAKFFEDVPIVDFEFVTITCKQTWPTELRRYDWLAAIGWLGLFIGHLEEEQRT